MKKFLTIILTALLLFTPATVFAEGEENNNETNNPTENNENNNENNENNNQTNEEVVDNTLSSIVVNGGTLSPSFNKTTYEYTITAIVPDAFSISYTQSSPDKTLVVMNPSSGKLEDIANKADKTATITVTYTDSEDKQHTNTYKIRVDYEVPEKSANLSSLTVKGYEFKDGKKFDKDTIVYSLEIPKEVDTITIEATAEDSTATITYDGGTSNIISKLKEDQNNRIQIVVKSGNKSKTYTLNVMRVDELGTTQDDSDLGLDDETNELDDQTTGEAKVDETTNEKERDTPEINTVFNRIFVPFASLIGIALGVIGIYIYSKTSPKRMKKEIIGLRDEKEKSAMVEVKPEPKKEMVEDLVETKEFNPDDLNKDA